MPLARQWWDERRQDWIEFDVPELEVYPPDVEPVILYGSRGEILVSWTPAVGFARAIGE